jgi:redox-sensitive bicupin YhaK (pirin superfamily)
VLILTLRLSPGARLRLPAAEAGLHRSLYLFAGGPTSIAGQTLRPKVGARLQPEADVELINGGQMSELLLLQARPIGEPVVQHGPFVMNTAAGIQQAFADYQRTRFGGWPWKRSDPVHAREEGRFARHADGRFEFPGGPRP